MNNVKTIEWKDDKLILIDCTKLQLNEEYIVCDNYLALVKAINCLSVRGAPAIGVSAAYGVVLAAIEAENLNLSKEEYINYIEESIVVLASTRPTAVNLFWALDRVKGVLEDVKKCSKSKIKEILLQQANLLFQEDIICNKKIGKYGNEVVVPGANVLTHCNAGALATAGYGTALGVIRSAHNSGKGIHVFADETRPLLQGARLTAWELIKEGIPCTLLTDSMAGYAMKLGKIDVVITGADRITSNGDTANKIGTYSLAVLARENGIPFYIAAPLSTIDLSLKQGSEIEIEERDKWEIKSLFGTQIAPDTVNTFNPAFDVTPSKYIAGIITEKGILKPPYEISIANAFK